MIVRLEALMGLRVGLVGLVAVRCGDALLTATEVCDWWHNAPQL